MSKKAANLINKFGNFATDKRITSSVLSIYHNDKLKKYIGSSKVKQSKLTNFLILNINNITNTVILKNDEFKKYLEFINTFNGEDVLLAYSNQISFDDIYEMIGDDFFQNLRTPHFSQKKNRLNLFFTVAIFHALFSKFEDNEKNCKELIYKNNQIASLVKYFAWRISISHVNFFENIKVYKKKIIDEVLQKRVRFITRREIFRLLKVNEQNLSAMRAISLLLESGILVEIMPYIREHKPGPRKAMYRVNHIRLEA